MTRLLPISIIISILTFCLTACDKTEDSDEYYVLRTDPLTTVTELNTQVLTQRADMGYFCDIDSARGLLLFIDGTKHRIIGLKNATSTAEVLFNLTDMNESFTGVINSIAVLHDGTYLIYEYISDGCDRVWKLYPDEKTLEMVFTLRNKYQRLKWNWGLEYDTDTWTLYMSEYGNSGDNPYDVGNSHFSYKGDATKIWKSVDNGKTWTEFADFRNESSLDCDRFHIHGIKYDHYTHCLFVTTGDGDVEDEKSNKRLFWTDLQSTGQPVWKSRDWRYYWGKTNDAFSHGQCVSFFVDKDFILAGGDDYNNCIYRINKTDTISSMQMERVYYYNQNVSGLITQYTQHWEKLSNGLIITFLANGDGNGFPRQARIVGTYNGYDWYEIYKGQTETADMNLNQMGVVKEWKGHLYFSITTCNNSSVTNAIPDNNNPSHVTTFIELEMPK